jgi:multidrug efflux pump
MMIDFALDAERNHGKSPRQLSGLFPRFRPIMMTTMAALLGALPLARGPGDPAREYVPLGITLLGGRMVSQVLLSTRLPSFFYSTTQPPKRPRLIAAARRQRRFRRSRYEPSSPFIHRPVATVL